MLKRFAVGMLSLMFCLAVIPTQAEIKPYTPIKGNLILPDGYHLLAAKAINGTLVELEDGSQFKVLDSDTEVVLDWESHAPLTISGNSNPKWIRGADYYIINQRDGTYVRANYYQSPVVEHPFTNVIHHIDPYYGEVYLRDGRGTKSCWQIDPKDLYCIRGWEKGDTVLIGTNDGFMASWRSKAEHILISYENSDQVTFVRATRKQL